MARNVRALTLKVNAREFDEKLSDIKRLKGALTKFIDEVVPRGSRDGVDSLDATSDIGGELEVKVQCSFRRHSERVSFELWREDVQIRDDRQLTLGLVRRLHDNLDVLVECAENICEDAGRLAEFQAKMKRFEV